MIVVYCNIHFNEVYGSIHYNVIYGNIHYNGSKLNHTYLNLLVGRMLV